MIKMEFHTNLDLLPAETWPKELPCVPAVGDEIESAMIWKSQFTSGSRLKLKVVAVRWTHCKLRKDIDHRDDPGEWYPKVELHLPDNHFENITAFFEWYGKITGKGKSFFI